MNIYRVTFHGFNCENFKTLIRAKSLEELNNNINESIRNNRVFEVEGKVNRYFVVQTENHIFREYEVLFSDSGMNFDKIIKLNDSDMRLLFEHVRDITLIAISLKNLTKDCVNQVLSVFPEGRRKIVTEEMESLSTLTLSEIVDAQEVVISVAMELKAEGKINF